jgi:hypothetical protein
MKAAALALAATALQGCAFIAGPCTAELRPTEGLLACERGGLLVILRPPPTIKAAAEFVNAKEPPNEP